MKQQETKGFIFTLFIFTYLYTFFSFPIYANKCQRKAKKPTTLGTQDEDKSINNKRNTTQYVLNNTIPKQTQIR